MSMSGLGSHSNFSKRGTLIAGLASVMAAGCTSLRLGRQPVVLFVCEYGTAKSAIARELFRRKIKERGAAVEAFSRGLKIEDHVSPQLKSRLASEGIDTLRDVPTILQRADWERASVVVAFNPLPPAVPRTKMRDWTDLPSVNDDYTNAMAILDRRLVALLDELVAGA
jgi:protein-tyrosine-phosphatase